MADTPAEFWYEDVTPEAAARYLERNLTDNRKIRPVRVQRYADAMAAGKWLAGAAPVQLDTNDLLINGQHRLWAVLESGRTVRMLFQRNVPLESFQVLDTGAPRSTGDILRLAGYENPDLLASASRMALQWERGQLRERTYPPPHEVLAWLRGNEDIQDRMRDGGRFSYSSGIKSPRGISTAFLLYAYRASSADYPEFVELTLTGTGGRGHPTTALRNLFLNRALRRTNYTNYQMGAMMSKAWNLYMLGESVTMINFRVGGAKPEAFPTLLTQRDTA